MARLASKAKMGFYPTPEETLWEIREVISYPPGRGGFNILDPCCGEGEALRRIAPYGDSCRTWGIELDVDRTDIASGVLDEVVQGSIFDARVNPLGSMGLLWLNPPYDDGGDGEREEMKFLKHSIKWLCTGGVLVFIVPERIFASDKNRKWISEHFDVCVVARVHRDEYPVFRQAVLFAKKRPAREDIEISFPPPPYEHIEDLDIPHYAVPVIPGPEVFQCGETLTDEEIAKNCPQVEEKVRRILNERGEVGALSPLFPLRKGHLVALITAGLLNGKVHNPDGTFILIKGYSSRVQSTRHEDNKEITTDTYQVGIRVIDPKAGQWYDIT